MTNILHITASIRSETSVSRSLGNDVIARLNAGGKAALTTRDLSAEPLPLLSEDRFNANLTPADERSAEQAELAAISDTLIAELQAADTIVISSPIYNFGVPASVKAWADLVARAGTTFKYTPDGPVGLLSGKKAVIAIASGASVVSHVNDSGFWLVSCYFGISVGQTLASWTVASTLVGLTGFVIALILSAAV